MELDTYLRFVAALVFVLALIGALTWAVKRYGLFGRVAPTPRGGRRLAVVESATIDVRRRLVLVRRDDAEHLLLLGPTGDLRLWTTRFRGSVCTGDVACLPAHLVPPDGGGARHRCRRCCTTGQDPAEVEPVCSTRHLARPVGANERGGWGRNAAATTAASSG